jgi:hypothetical protein
VLILLALCVLAIVGRIGLVLEERRAPKRDREDGDDRGEPLNLRHRRDLLILIVAIGLGLASAVVLLGIALRL